MRPHHVKIASEVLADRLPGAEVSEQANGTVSAILDTLIVAVLRGELHWGARAVRVGGGIGRHCASVSVYEAVDAALASQHASVAARRDLAGAVLGLVGGSGPGPSDTSQ